MSDDELTIDEQVQQLVDQKAPRSDIKDLLAQHYETVIDLEDYSSPGDHRWVDRGVVLSCEGAAHPNHRHYKQWR